MNPISQLSAVPASPAGATPKILRAGREFEAVLLNSLFGSLEHSFSSLPGSQHEPSSDNYHSLGMQALATSVAAHGGLGIADMIVRSLLKNKGGEVKTPMTHG